MKKFLPYIVFMLTTPVLIGFSLVSLLVNSPKPAVKGVTTTSSHFMAVPPQVFAALPENNRPLIFEPVVKDARTLIIQKYLQRYQSPMAPYANLLVTASDQNQLDWRLLVAIAQQESNLGKKIPENSYNAWGWGIHSQGSLRFNSWEEGIQTVAKGLKEKYVDKGFTSVEEIMAKYCPLSNGSWAHGVNQFLEELETGKIE